MTTKDKLVPDEPTLVVWVLYDATADKKYIKMDPVGGSLAIFDSEEAAIAAKKLHCGTDYKRCEYYSAPAVQSSTKCPGAGCTDQGCPAHYATPDVAKLVEALEGLLSIVSDSYGVAGYHTNGDIAEWDEFEEVEMAEEALAAFTAYRKEGGQ